MGRSSRISKLGLGDKIIAYYVSGMPIVDIVRKMNIEHEGAALNRFHVMNHLKQHSELVRSIRGEAIGESLSLTIESVQSSLVETIEEIRIQLEEHGENPAHTAKFLKLKLDALECMAKLLGGFAPEQQVNVQVGMLYTQDNFERSLKEAEEYFRRIEAEAANE